MKLYDLPFLNGKKTAIGVWGGLLIAIGNLTFAIGQVLQGEMEITGLVIAVQIFFAAFAAFGIAHKAAKIEAK